MLRKLKFIFTCNLLHCLNLHISTFHISFVIWLKPQVYTLMVSISVYTFQPTFSHYSFILIILLMLHVLFIFDYTDCSNNQFAVPSHLNTDKRLQYPIPLIESIEFDIGKNVISYEVRLTLTHLSASLFSCVYTSYDGYREQPHFQSSSSLWRNFFHN